MQTALFTATSELELAALRTELARNLNVDPVKIWSNKVMQELLIAQPTSVMDLMRIKGLTKRKAQEFGPKIVAVFGGIIETSETITTKDHLLLKP
jgi:ribonuclease D